MTTTTIRPLRVIPEPKEGTRTVFYRPLGEPDSSVFFIVTDVANTSPEKIDYVCGKCGTPLITGAREGQFKNLVLHCNQCESYNDMATLPPGTH